MPLDEHAPVIVLDGPAGAGKSTVAREVARRLGLPFLDTGAIYRAITLVMKRRGIPPIDSGELRDALEKFSISFSGTRVFVDGEDVTDAIRTPDIDTSVSPYSALPVVRASLLDIQRSRKESGLVAEGRDMGTVVFPNADVKIFLTASPEERARRRYDERTANGEPADYGEILRQVAERDSIDSTRDAAPLQPAVDAVTLDSTGMSFEDVVERIMERASGTRANG
ncbi:MAG: (d)CMP kinase [Synergistaceae bacterium]|jgi:cytidylate kinase|nr:(d)CMP kinase [Synergistaceae bacterium]